MKASETVIVRYCDFCPTEKKTKTTERCGVCLSDVCEAHRYLVVVEKKNRAKRLFGEGPPNAVRLLIQNNLVPVCPECSNQSLFKLLESLSTSANLVLRS